MRFGHRQSTVRRLVLVAVLASLFAGLVPSPAVAAYGANVNRRGMLKATNSSRIVHEIQRVRLHKELSELARRHSLKMAKAGELRHTQDPASYYLEGVTWRTWGENVGVTGGTIKDLQKAFMKSTGHRKNVLNEAFRHAAIGAVRVDGILWVTVFFYG